MKLSLNALAMLSIGLTLAAASPMPGKHGPPGPPGGTVGEASQSCGNSISLSSLHCCTQSRSGNAGEKGGSKGKGDSHKVVKTNDSAYDMQCSAIAGQ